MSALVEVTGLRKHFPLAEKGLEVVAVNDISFEIGRGETFGLVGESGSGKTTVGRCILRLLEPTAGQIIFDDEDITSLDADRLRRLRPRMQLVFQEPYASLNPRMSVRQTVEEPLALHDVVTGPERRDRLHSTLESVQLDQRHLDRYPSELSPSEQQRVGIARAIVTQPDLIVLDEPTSMLDPSVRAEVLDVLVSIQEQLGTSYLFISHDLTAVQRVSHRIAIMYLGRLVEFAPTADIFQQQRHPYSKALLSAVLYPDPRRKLDPFVLEGEIPSAVNPPDECPLHGRCPIGQPYCTKAFPPIEEVAPGHWAACYRSKEFAEGLLSDPTTPASPNGFLAGAGGDLPEAGVQEQVTEMDVRDPDP